MSKKRFLFFLILTTAVMITGLVWSFRVESEPLKKVGISLGQANIIAEVADTEVSRIRGLSGRSELSPGTGMWFTYPDDGLYSFWMPDMHFPIDIIWFNSDEKVVYVKENATPESYPETFTNSIPARYILEVPSGFVKEYGISTGTKAVVHSQG